MQQSRIRRFFAWAYKAELIESDPSLNLKLKIIQKPLQPKALDKRDIHKILTLAGKGRFGHRNYALTQVLLQTGLRIGEIENLNMAEVSLYDRSGEVRVRDGKGRKERVVPLNSSARKALREYFEDRKKKALLQRLIF